MNPSDCWAMLLKPSPEQLLSTSKFRELGNGRAVFLGRDASNRFHCLVPIEKSSQGVDRRSKAVWLVRQELEQAGEQVMYADLICMDSSLVTVFEHLVREVVHRVSSSEDSVVAIHSTLNDWKALLDTNRERPSPESVKGLRGELEILYRLVVKHGTDAVRKWRGPYGAALDFLSANVALEVKTTTAQSGSIINIHDIRQVTPPTGCELAVIYVRLEENENGQSVKSLVDKLFSLGCDRSLLSDALAKLSYDEVEEEWSRRFEVIQVSAWLVTEDFPGLRENRILDPGMNGVTQLRYQLDLAAAGAPVSNLGLDELLQNFGVEV